MRISNQDQVEIGDTIIVLKDFVFDYAKFTEGMTGTVISKHNDEYQYNRNVISIDWGFRNSDFHTCGGLLTHATGYNLNLPEVFIGHLVDVSDTGTAKPNPLPDDPRLRGICIKIKQMEDRFKRKQLAKKLTTSGGSSYVTTASVMPF